MDRNLTDKIVSKAGDITGKQVLEVGPGPGGLTQSILKRVPERLVVVEKDQRFKPTLDMLADSFSAINGKMDIIYDDIKKTNIEILFPMEKKRNWNGKPPDIFIIGNLPFNVSTHLIIKWFRAISEQSGPWAFGRTKMTLTFQKEVAERLVAQPMENQRCGLSVMAQTWTFPLLRFIIPGNQTACTLLHSSYKLFCFIEFLLQFIIYRQSFCSKTGCRCGSGVVYAVGQTTHAT